MIATNFFFFSVSFFVFVPFGESQINLLPNLPISYNEALQIIQTVLEEFDQNECTDQIQVVIKSSTQGELWALKMIDAMAKPQSGILFGNLMHVGNYDECLEIDEKITKNHIQGKYCSAIFQPHPKYGEKFEEILNDLLVPKKKCTDWQTRCRTNSNDSMTESGYLVVNCIMTNDQLLSKVAAGNTSFLVLPTVLEFSVLPTDSGNYKRNDDNNTITEIAKVTYGFCVPKICTAQQLNDIIYKIAELTQSPVTFNFVDKFCDTNDRREFTSGAILGIVIFSLFALLLFCGTLFEILLNNQEKKLRARGKLLLAFSVINNTKKLFSTHTSENSLNCLNGLRVISMMWIVIAHEFQSAFFVPHVNALQILEWKNQTENAFITASAMAVDTFFAISGLLVVYLFMMSQAKNVKFNLPMFYLHRILRLTPALAMVTLLTTTFLVYMGRGPFWPVVEELFQTPCNNNWWSTLVYLQNYINPEEQCVGQAWYLAVDTQMYFLSPLILFPLLYYPKPTIVSICVFVVLNCCYVFEITFKKHLGTTFLNQDAEQYKLLYSPTHVRGTVYLIGMLCGFFIYKSKTTSKKLILTKIQIFFGWIFSLSIMVAIVLAHSTMTSSPEYPILESAFFNALTRVAWGVALSLIIFLCVNDYGGAINSFLSCNVFNVLIRFNYSVYLLHINMLILLTAQGRTPTYFSNMLGFYNFWGDYMFSLGAAFIWTLAFESSVIGIEKIIFTPRKKNELHVNN